MIFKGNRLNEYPLAIDEYHLLITDFSALVENVDFFSSPSIEF